MTQGSVVIIGAGIGGLVTAALLASRGHGVHVIEKEPTVGGKARRLAVDAAAIDAGPTVFTLRQVFEDIFAACGASLDEKLTITRAEVIARHSWAPGGHLDLFADSPRSEEAIGDFAGPEAAAGYRSFTREAARIYGILENSFLTAPKAAWPGPLMWRIGLWRMGALLAIRPYESLWKVLGEHFADPRLRQLYGRYATYCGSSPFDCPATLMLIAHVEAQGVWLIEGGMSALAEALRDLAVACGARVSTGRTAARIEVARGRARGVVLADGERLPAAAVIVNADPAALGSGLFGREAAQAVRAMAERNRSLSALTWLAHARTDGFPLLRHNVIFSDDYAREFAEISGGRSPGRPTVYVCAQDRDAGGAAVAPTGRERLQIIVNAPADGDRHSYTQEERERCTRAMTAALARCGLELEDPLPHTLVTPSDYAALFPSTGGAIYGRASHGWAASFLRQGTRTRIPGLYCAGGSTHPGAGVPMAALSGRLAADTVSRDLASIRRFHPAAMAGGMSMRSATTGSTA